MQGERQPLGQVENRVQRPELPYPDVAVHDGDDVQPAGQGDVLDHCGGAQRPGEIGQGRRYRSPELSCSLPPLVVSDLSLETELPRAERAGRPADVAGLVDVAADDAQFGQHVGERVVPPSDRRVVQVTRPTDLGPRKGLLSRTVLDGQAESQRGQIDAVPGDVRPHVGGRDSGRVVIENAQPGARGGSGGRPVAVRLVHQRLRVPGTGSEGGGAPSARTSGAGQQGDGPVRPAAVQLTLPGHQARFERDVGPQTARAGYRPLQVGRSDARRATRELIGQHQHPGEGGELGVSEAVEFSRRRPGLEEGRAEIPVELLGAR